MSWSEIIEIEYANTGLMPEKAAILKRSGSKANGSVCYDSIHSVKRGKIEKYSFRL
jgi:hypothetical protein